MRAKRNGVPLEQWKTRRLADPAIDDRGAKGSRSVALMVTVVAILMMVAM
jgi:hypothetical protein